MQFNVYKHAKDNTPPRKKGPRSLAFIYALVDVVAYGFYLFKLWIYGSTDPVYVAGTYNLRDRVEYRRGIYESLIDNNTSTPDDVTKWRLLQLVHVSAISRAKYTGHKMILEYALNKIFKTTWNGAPVTPYGDIYITNTTDIEGSFIVGIDEEESSSVFEFDSSGYIFDTEVSSAGINFTIHIPIAVYNSLGTDDPARENAVREIADRYVVEGLVYEIVTY